MYTRSTCKERPLKGVGADERATVCERYPKTATYRESMVPYCYQQYFRTHKMSREASRTFRRKAQRTVVQTATKTPRSRSSACPHSWSSSGSSPSSVEGTSPVPLHPLVIRIARAVCFPQYRAIVLPAFLLIQRKISFMWLPTCLLVLSLRCRLRHRLRCLL